MVSEREVVQVVRSPVLLRDDALYMMPQFTMNLTDPAVFAPFAGSTANELASSRIHLLNRQIEVLPSLQLENGNEVCRIDERLVLGAFTLGELALVRSGRERVYQLLDRRGNLKLDDAPRGAVIQAAAERFQQRV